MKLGFHYAKTALAQPPVERQALFEQARECYRGAMAPDLSHPSHPSDPPQDIEALAGLAEIEFLTGHAEESFKLYNQCLEHSLDPVGTALYVTLYFVCMLMLMCCIPSTKQRPIHPYFEGCT